MKSATRQKGPHVKTKKGVIGILTGGGDVPGLNPAIRAVTIRALREGCEVIGIRRGWAGLVDLVGEKGYDNSENFQTLSEDLVNRTGRTGGTFLHTSRTNPSRVKNDSVPVHLQSTYDAEKNDLTAEVLTNLDWLGIDYLIPIGGDDTLSYGVRLYQEGVKVVAIPKTMDNDVPGTDYCIGFSTLCSRYHFHDEQPAYQCWFHKRSGAGGLRPVCRVHCHAAHHGWCGEPLCDSRSTSSTSSAPHRVAGRGSPEKPQSLLSGPGFGGRDVPWRRRWSSRRRTTDAFGHRGN